MAPCSLLHQKPWFSSASTAASETAISCYSSGTTCRITTASKYRRRPQSKVLLSETLHTYIGSSCSIYPLFTWPCICNDITAWKFDLCSLKPSAQLTSLRAPILPPILCSFSSSSPYLSKTHPCLSSTISLLLPSPAVFLCRHLFSTFLLSIQLSFSCIIPLLSPNPSLPPHLYSPSQ